jgi:hypothetical protein
METIREKASSHAEQMTFAAAICAARFAKSSSARRAMGELLQKLEGWIMHVQLEAAVFIR